MFSNNIGSSVALICLVNLYCIQNVQLFLCGCARKIGNEGFVGYAVISKNKVIESPRLPTLMYNKVILNMYISHILFFEFLKSVFILIISLYVCCQDTAITPFWDIKQYSVLFHLSIQGVPSIMQKLVLLQFSFLLSTVSIHPSFVPA